MITSLVKREKYTSQLSERLNHTEKAMDLGKSRSIRSFDISQRCIRNVTRSASLFNGRNLEWLCREANLKEGGKEGR